MSRKTLLAWVSLFGLGIGFAATAEPVTYVLQTPGVV